MEPVRFVSDRAMDNLRYIRETMERATPFTGISGRGEMAIGVTALAASVIAARQPSFKLWVYTWLAEGFISLLIAGWSMDRKARATQTLAVLRIGTQSPLQSRALSSSPAVS